MKLASMQPYLFPYIGYFQLINAVDKFIVYDNVQHIRKGWITRNKILINGLPCYFIFSLKKDSFHLNINERYWKNMSQEKDVFLKKIFLAYKRAPFFDAVFQLIKEIFKCEEYNISVFITNSIKEVCRYLEIKTPFFINSEISIGDDLEKGQRIITKSIKMGAKHFINPIGGIKLYSKAQFKEYGIKLDFLKTRYIEYKQFNNKFVPNLSIIDVMMFNSKDRIKELLEEYDLV